VHREIFTVTVTTNIGIGVNATDVIRFTPENCLVFCFVYSVIT